MNSIQAIIFDMDGLLVDSEPLWDRARHEMTAALGKEWNYEDARAVMGVSTAWWVDYTIRRLDLKLSPREFKNDLIFRMAAFFQQGVPFMPGALEALNLAHANFPLALASGSPPELIQIFIQQPEVQGKFKAVVSSDEVSSGKPEPHVFLEAARRLGVRAQRCLVFEDADKGIRAAKAAGMKVIAVPDKRFAPPAETLRLADRVLDSLADFTLDSIPASP